MANHWKWRKLSISSTCLWRKQGHLAEVSVWKVLCVTSSAHPPSWGGSLTTSELSTRQPKRLWREDLSKHLWRSLIKPSCRLSSVASNQQRSLWTCDMSSDYCVCSIDVDCLSHWKSHGEKQPITCFLPCMCWERHTQTQSLCGELLGSSRCLLWCQQLPHQKHPDTSFHIHNYMMKGKGGRG